ncbi:MULTISPECIES: hypothetical protein [unclassified Xanthomonas]|uniref:hypothetical protein n=1 Tax=Xanthomonas sp. LMG 8992 TaxID=1591157 RepID=UPI00136F9294|nr:hypothetical protein [Xanthomonas sp. LMG 8992]
MYSLLLAAALAATPNSPPPLTAQEARTLPLHELAKRLLGASGSIMIDVDRPRYDSLEPIRFYGHAIAWGSYFGVCASDLVTVEFDEQDRIESLQSQRRFGVEGDIHRAPGEWDYDEFGKICSAVTSTRNYFPAPDHGAALDIALYIEALAGKGPFAKQRFEYACSGACSDKRTELSWLRLDEIKAARSIDCDSVTLKLPTCYEIQIGSGVGPFPKMFRVYGSNYMNKTVVVRVSVDVGMTLTKTGGEQEMRLESTPSRRLVTARRP